MNYEEKIKELSDRIEKLEKYENKRQLKRKIQFSLKVLKVIIVLVVIVVVYIKYVQPYKEKIDYVEEKVNTVESFVKDKWEMIRKYNPF